MDALQAPPIYTAAFVALTAILVSANVMFVRWAAPVERKARWTVVAAASAVLWLGLHAAIASSGMLGADTMPPPVMPYVFLVTVSGMVVAFSPVGQRLAALPIGALVGLQAFRVPLEVILHGLYEAGALPVQMTWSGSNFDVLTGLLAVVLAVVYWPSRPEREAKWPVWIWNLMGLTLLITVVSIAVMSAPTPLRRFMNDPPVLLAYDVPFNWIVNVHVWTAWVGHLVIFRALWSRRAEGKRA